MFYFLVIITFFPPSKKFHFKTYRDWILHLLSDPLGNKVVAEDDDGGAGNEPKCVEAEKRVIEAALRQNRFILYSFFWFEVCHLLWIMLEGEECGVYEHQPADHPHDDQTVTKHRVVEV